MDYMSFVMEHVTRNADITIACIPCGYDRASDYGLMKVDDDGRVEVGARDSSPLACSRVWSKLF